MSLVGKTSSLDLEAETNEQLSAFMFGLQGLLTAGGRDVVVDEAEEERQAAAAAAAPAVSAPKRGGKRFSILGTSLENIEQSRHANFKKTILSLPADQNLQAMQTGHAVTIFSIDPVSQQVQKSSGFAWFQAVPGQKFGSICWGQEKNRADKQIDLAKVTDVYG